MSIPRSTPFEGMIGGMFGGGFNRYCGDGSAATVVTMSAVSRRFQAHYGIRSEASAISLLLRFAKTNLRLARNRYRSRISIRPMHLFGHNRDHDYYFRLLREEERDAQSITRCCVHTIA
jgi:hypothetical protein